MAVASERAAAGDVVGCAGEREDGPVVVRVAMQVEEGRAGTGGQRGENGLVAALAHVDDALEAARARGHGRQRASTGDAARPTRLKGRKRKRKGREAVDRGGGRLSRAARRGYLAATAWERRRRRRMRRRSRSDAPPQTPWSM